MVIYMDGYVYGISPTKKSIQEYISLYSNCSDMELVECFDTLRTRHICKGIKQIVILDQSTIPVQTTKGLINVSVFFCGRCRKIIIDKSSMEFVGY